MNDLRHYNGRVGLDPPIKCQWKEFFAYLTERYNEFVLPTGESLSIENHSSYQQRLEHFTSVPSCKTCGCQSRIPPIVIYVSKHIPGFLECSGFGEVKCFTMPFCDVCDVLPAEGIIRSCVHDSADVPRF